MEARVFQDIGDRLTKALITGDYALYQSLMVFPLEIVPGDAPAHVMADDADLRADFDLYHEIITLHGVTDIFRDVQQVVPDGPDRVVVWMMIHILQRAYRIVDPIASRFHLRRVGNEWRIARIESSEGHINWTLGRGTVTADRQFKTVGGHDAET